MVTIQWIKGEVPQNVLIKQVYGIVFDQHGRIFLRIEDGAYKLTGGKPEKFDTSLEETLKREFLEEANITLKNIHMLGYQYVDEQNDIKPYAQVRMIAQIDKIGEPKEDPDTKKLYQRLLTSPKKAKQYLNWGKVGDEQVDDAVSLAIEKYNLTNESYVEEWI